MTYISTDAFRNVAIERYNALVEHLNHDDLYKYKITPKDYVNAVNSSGLREIFGTDQAGNVYLHFDKNPEFDDMSQPLIIQLGSVPEEYRDNNKDFVTDDGSARITVQDDSLDYIRFRVNKGAVLDLLNFRDNFADDFVSITSISDYSLQYFDENASVPIRQWHIDYVNINGSGMSDSNSQFRTDSDIQFIYNSDARSISAGIAKVDDHLCVHKEYERVFADNIDMSKLIDEHSDITTTHEIKLFEHAHPADGYINIGSTGTLSIDGRHILITEDYTWRTAESLADIYENNSATIDIALNNGIVFDNLNDLRDCASNVSAYLELRSDVAEKQPELIDEFDRAIVRKYGNTASYDMAKIVADIESSAVNDADCKHNNVESPAVIES